MDTIQQWFQGAAFGNGLIAFTVVGLAVTVTAVSRVFRPGRI